MTRTAKLLAVMNTLLVMGYPVAVYVGLTRLSARGIGVLMLLLLAPSLAMKWRNARREDLLVAIRVPLSIMAVAGLSAVLNDKRLVLSVPVLINLLLLLQFASSLRATPIVERFARMQQPELSLAQVAYCRQVTKVWCAFFVLNALASAYLAVRGPLWMWTLYTGAIAYGLIGLVASVEYITRKARFREYGAGLHDRILSRVFPPHSGATP